MTNKNIFGLSVIATIASLVAIGCGPGGPATAPAKGTLTIDGQPADNVSITLIPVGGGEGAMEAAGQVKGGSFELFTGNKGTPGAMPGKYKVVLSQMGGAGGTTQYQNQGQGGGGGGTETPEQQLSFPEKYLSPDTSDKEVEITSGSNELTIEITS